MNKQIKKMNAVMMEYVLIAVLIAAAVVGAVIMFGGSIGQGLNVASDAIVDPKRVEYDVQFNKGVKDTQKDMADEKLNEIHGN